MSEPQDKADAATILAGARDRLSGSEMEALERISSGEPKDNSEEVRDLEEQVKRAQEDLVELEEELAGLRAADGREDIETLNRLRTEFAELIQ